MKLKEFNPENTTSDGRQRKPGGSINVKTGLFSINGAGCAMVGITAKDQVQLLQDQEDPEVWYIEKVKSGGFSLRGKGDAQLLSFNSSPLIRMLSDSIGATAGNIGYLIAGQPTKFEKRTFHGLLFTRK